MMVVSTFGGVIRVGFSFQYKLDRGKGKLRTGVESSERRLLSTIAENQTRLEL